MDEIPSSIRKRLAYLGRLSAPLDDRRAIELATAVSAAVARHLLKRADAGRTIEIYEARIQAEVHAARESASQWAGKPNIPPLSEILERFADEQRYDAVR